MSTLEMVNPATGEALGQLAEATPAEVGQAMIDAREAFAQWREVPLRERLGYMKRLREIIVDQASELAKKISQDTGKVQLESLMSDIYPTVGLIRYYEKKAPSILKRKRVPMTIALFGRFSHVEYRPMGVIAVISPWNYPFQLSLAPVVSALIAGNTVILKPSEVSPFTGQVIGELLEQAGFPKGVVQVLHGGKDVGKQLVEARPDKIFFTGSSATGKKIMAAAAEHLIPVELELGGKDPMIVFADADLDRAVNGALWGGFTNAGQTCMAVERVYVEDAIFEKFVQQLVVKAKALRVGRGEGRDVGSMTYPHQLKIVEEHLKDAVDKGARILCGGRRLNEETLHFEPTVLVDVDHSMRIMREETFGPVIPVMRFSLESEAVQLANDSPYGLNGSVWSKDLHKARRVASRIESGNICINDVMIGIAHPALPYGGNKESGMGRYHGPEGLKSFSHTVSVVTSPGRKKREINWFPYSRDQYTAISELLKDLYGKSFRPSLKGLIKVGTEFFRSK
ncbi:aldehyde dehydrogenase [Marinithermofilum abyssi]|uniref:Aldehyde dehydrogenase n=1 Tax=Marinithermofilum abyssi TaxID=1571185 RepID=A0A8J2VCS1_9BACL|nr:aldehyde dehydrogenase family protein [Marinithermofilum abyssi]GGE13796.1 aldehyde dehydrogenase [Marinithermofilum abyssi]